MTVGETDSSTEDRAASAVPAKTPPRADKAGLAALADTTTRIRRAVESVIEGKRDTVRLAITVMLAEGHLLIEDVPGVGKTMLAKALARSVDCSVRRVQFTPDLLPSDITGVSIYNQERREFEFKPGAIFANIVVGDEINRASPKTQSALLECMEERQVTVDGETYELAIPFMVLATQNPIEMEGTYPLPEAQRDRFMVRLSMGYPNEAAELRMLDTHGQSSPLDDLQAVSDATEIAELMRVVRSIHVSDQVRQYAVDLVLATRSSPELRLGASPRATLHLIRAARAAAALDDRDYVLPDDVQDLARPGARPPAAADRRGPDRPPVDRGHRGRHRRHGRPARRDPGPAGKRLVRDALQGLTTRGRCFVAAGLAVLVGSIATSQKDLLRVAILLLALPLVSAVVVARTRYRLSSRRRIGSARTAAGQETSVTLRLDNISRLPTGLLLVEDKVPYVLGSRPRFVLDRVEPRGRREVTYAVRSDVRGRFTPRAAHHPADRPVRHVRAAALVQQPGHPGRHPGGAVAAVGPALRASGRAAARAGPGRWPAPVRTTPASGSTARATTCAGCTGARRPGWTR